MKTNVLTSDHYSIAMTFYEPELNSAFNPPFKGSILIAPAMGVSQEFYAPLANWLATQGFRVASFDYRGMGRSKHEPLSELKANLFDWMKLDASAALNALMQRAGAGDIFWVGHSLGGQIFAFVDHHEKIKKMITFTSGSGYWLTNALSLRWRVWFLWFVVVPITVPIFGYFPGKRLRMVGDLPADVMWQWRRWCLNRNYSVGAEPKWVEEVYASVKVPITAISFTDDELMSQQSIDDLHAFYIHANQKMLRVKPSDYGLSKIGHFGFFRERMKESLWKKLLLPELK